MVPISESSAPVSSSPATQKTNIFAILSLVSAFFISLLAVIFGHVALSQIKKTGESGHGLAVAGLILGYLGLAAGIIVFIIWIGIFVLAAATGEMSMTY